MRALLLVTGAFLLVVAALWYARLCRELRLLQDEMRAAWRQLRDALSARRELVLYLIASLDRHVWPEVEVLANACDLASNVSGVMETAEAEARLEAILERMRGRLAGVPPGEDASARRWLEQLQSASLYINMLATTYNQHVEAFNQRRCMLPALMAAWCRVEAPAAFYRVAEQEAASVAHARRHLRQPVS